eukprot:7576466-Karenia_brevis.AAC.1
MPSVWEKFIELEEYGEKWHAIQLFATAFVSLHVPPTNHPVDAVVAVLDEVAAAISNWRKWFTRPAEH